MKEITLEKRILTGKKAKRLYDKGLVPSILFNSKGESYNTQIEKGQLEALLQDATTSTVISINYEGKESKALIKDLDINPINGQYRHIGFFEIDENQVMTFDIPIKLTGVSPAVKNNIGVLVQPTKSLELRFKYADLVDDIEIDISKMETPGDSITMRDIKLPKGATVINENQYEKSIASITQLQKLVETEEEVEGEALLDEEGNEILDEEGNVVMAEVELDEDGNPIVKEDGEDESEEEAKPGEGKPTEE